MSKWLLRGRRVFRRQIERGASSSTPTPRGSSATSGAPVSTWALLAVEGMALGLVLVITKLAGWW